MAQANYNIEEGKKCMKQGNKMAKGGIFSKANPDDAEKMYEKARKKFRFIKPQTAQTVQLHLDSVEALATVRETMNLNNSAAAAMEEAARTCRNAADKKMEQFLSKIPEYLERGAYFYRLNKQYDLASRLMIKAANNNKDINAALKMLDLACEIQEEENRYITCHEFFDGAVKFCLVNKRYKDADGFLNRQNRMYGKDAEKFDKRIWRNILSKMIIQFHLKNVKDAQHMYYQGVEDFGFVSKVDEHKLCEDFLSVFSNADAEGLAHIQKNAQLGVFLINSVARIGTKLNMNDIRPTVIIDENEEKEKELELEKKENIDAAKKDITDEQLQSDLGNVQLDDDGAPNLVDM